MNRRAILSLIGTTVVAAGALAASSRQPAADIVIYNAHIYTVNASQPEAAAVAVLGERIVAVGTDAEVLRWRGPATHALDARGQLLLRSA